MPKIVELEKDEESILKEIKKGKITGLSNWEGKKVRLIFLNEKGE